MPSYLRCLSTAYFGACLLYDCMYVYIYIYMYMYVCVYAMYVCMHIIFILCTSRYRRYSDRSMSIRPRTLPGLPPLPPLFRIALAEASSETSGTRPLGQTPVNLAK